MRRSLLSSLCCCLVFSLACGGVPILDPLVVPEDTVVVGARGTPSHGPWPRVLGDTNNPGPQLRFTSGGKEWLPSNFRAAVYLPEAETLRSCGWALPVDTPDRRRMCWDLHSDGTVQVVLEVVPRVRPELPDDLQLSVTGQGVPILRRRVFDRATDQTQITFQMHDGVEWQDVKTPPDVQHLDQLPGGWIGLVGKDGNRATGVTAWRADGEPWAKTSLGKAEQVLMKVASERDQVALFTPREAKLWNLGDRPVPLLPAATTPDGSLEAFHGGVFGFGRLADHILVWSSRELGHVKTAPGASNPAFQPFLVDTRTLEFQRAGGASRGWAFVWGPAWLATYLTSEG